MVDILVYINKTKVKQQRCMLELHSFANDLGNFFAATDNIYKILEECFLNFFYALYNVMSTDVQL